MVYKKHAIDAGDTCAQGRLSEVEVLLDDAGPAWLVEGERHPTDAERLRYQGRRALAIAAALEGIPNDDPPIVDVEPFARIYPPRMPVEAGIPDDLVCCTDLTPLDRLAWIEMWRLAPHLTGKPPAFRGRRSWLAKLLGVTTQTLWGSMHRIDAVGWGTLRERAAPPSSYGELEMELHLVRRVGAPAANVIETTAEPKG